LRAGCRLEPAERLTVRRWVALALLVVCPLAARASDESDVLRARGALLAAEGKCGEAIPLFQRAIAADPKEARAGLLLGRCQIAAKQYPEAERTLDEALRRDPNLLEAQLELAIARYHQDNYAGARTALDAARPGLSGDARFQLYDGLVLLREGKRSEGIAALERARQIDPKLVEPTASYVAGLALENEGDRGQAREAMERVVATDPNGRWGTAARTRLDQWAFSRGRNYWAELTVGYESDSNVVLRGQGVDLPTDIADEADWRTIWNANAGYEFVNTPDWGLGAALNYTGTAQHVLTDFSYDYLVGSAWVDRRITQKLSAHMQGDYAYGWVDGDSWVSEVAGTPALDYTWAPNNYTRLFSRFYWSNYYFTPDLTTSWVVPPGFNVQDARNRDGHGEQVGLEQGYPLMPLNTQLTGAVLYGRYHAQGSEYDYRGVGTWLASETLLPWRLTLRLLGAFTYRGYLNNTTFETDPPVGPAPNSDNRRDQIADAEVSIERPIYWDWLLASGRWHYTHADSTVQVFDYDRIIYGAYLTIRIP
jgi:tetratricopeptide (TPR) repeat protein